MDTSARDCMVLFDTSVEGKLACGWDSGVLHQRTRTVKAGPMVYVDCYPVWDTAHARAASTEAKKEAHARAQKRLDAKNRANRLERLVNANFGAGDIMLTCEYPAGRQPGSDEQAKRDIRNMMNRVKRMRSRRGLPALRYIYITERTECSAYGVRWHHHVRRRADARGDRGEVDEAARRLLQHAPRAADRAPSVRLCAIPDDQQAGTRREEPAAESRRAELGQQHRAERADRKRGR